MKTPPLPNYHIRPRFRSLCFLSRTACRHGKFVAVLAGSSLLVAGSLRANTEDDVATETTTPQANPPNLNTGTSYTSGTAPVATSDLTFNATNFYSDTFTTAYTPATGVFAASGTAFNIGSLDDLSTSQAITVANGNSGTTGAIILNGGNSVSGNTADLLYVATGATLNVSNIKPGTGAVGNTVSINPAVSGNFDIVGTATISVPVAAGMIGSGGALAASASSITKTGAGMLTLSSATNNYTGGTFINAGTLATSGTGTLGTGNVTLTGTAVLTLGSATSLGSASTLRFASTGTINLNNATADTLTTIIDTDKSTVTLAPGTYTATQLNTNFGVTTFTGAGTLTETTAAAVPEPSTWVGILMAAGASGFALRRRMSVRLG